MKIEEQEKQLSSGGYPAWIEASDYIVNPDPDVMVAKDGSGQFTTIGQGVAAYPTTPSISYSGKVEPWSRQNREATIAGTIQHGDSGGDSILCAPESLISFWQDWLPENRRTLRFRPHTT